MKEFRRIARIFQQPLLNEQEKIRFYGHSKIKINNFELPGTLQDKPVTVSMKYDTVKVKPSWSNTDVKTIKVNPRMNVEFTVPYDSDTFSELQNVLGVDFNQEVVINTEVEIRIKNDEVITFEKVDCEIEVSLNFKRTSISEIKITGEVRKNQNNEYYSIGGIF